MPVCPKCKKEYSGESCPDCSAEKKAGNGGEHKSSEREGKKRSGISAPVALTAVLIAVLAVTALVAENRNWFKNPDASASAVRLMQGGEAEKEPVGFAEITDAPQSTLAVQAEPVYTEREKRHTVFFDPNGGTGSLSSMIVSHGGEVNFPTPARKGYNFIGWYTVSTGGSKIKSSTEITADTTLFAHWEPKTYTLTLDAGGGEVSPSVVKASFDSGAKLPKPTKSGYAFDGWFTSSYGGTEFTESTKITANTTLYAHWTESRIELASYSGSASVNIARTGTFSTTFPTYVGWRVTLPAITKNTAGGSSGKWEIVSGDAAFYNGELYQYQPGTLELRYTQNGAVSDIYTFTLKLYKITNGKNYLRAEPNGAQIASIPSNTKLDIKEFSYGSAPGIRHELYAKTVYNGTEGWVLGLNLDPFM